MDDGWIANGDLGGKLAINSVKMGRRMLIPIHSDDDAKKPADFRHTPLFRQMGGQDLPARVQ